MYQPPELDDTAPNHIGKYAPPPGLPPGYPRLVDFPFLSPDQIPTLYTQGYASLHLPSDHPLLIAATTLFATSRDFFAKPLNHKEQFHPSEFFQGKFDPSDEGWSCVEGEKELLSVRRTRPLCPPEVTQNAQILWQECGNLLQAMMCAVEKSLDLKDGAFDNLVSKECVLPLEEKHATLLRMFRYERTADPRLVAAHHCDIGLLSLVVGSSPGLDVWNDGTKQWVAIEDDGARKDGGLTLTLLSGRTLTRLTNERYKPGVHRVFVPPANPSSSADDGKYRYSLVFALRPHKDAIISTSALSSAVTGQFRYPLEGVKAQVVSSAIANAHWNVNVDEKERVAQRLRLQKLKAEGIPTQSHRF